MPQGYASLAKRRSTSQAIAVTDEYSAAAVKASRQASAGGLGRLHVVEADRPSSERFDISIYGPVAARDRGAHPIFKRVFDLVGASLAIVALSPLILTIVTFAYLSGGSPLFRHRRVGQQGVLFDCFKFRTMVTNADEVLQNLLERDSMIREEWLRDHKLRDDPRVTPFGRFMRRTSLDELPQLWNVLRGDMSLVGPRPVVPDELRRYGRKVAIFLSARPGITGLWQISGRNDTDYRRRVALDVCYVRSRSAILDVYILLRTLRVVFATRGAY
ncbi:MAG TPA: sugar transferase [Steroidobacteraceae bacterium]|nr:sugar transferase [Steroidobacteraceae bacterium]